MDSSTIRVSRTIPASPTVIWKVISDIDSMGSRSPQCKKMIALPLGSNPLHPGGTTLNINRRGKYTFWATTARFLTVKPEKELSFFIPANHLGHVLMSSSVDGVTGGRHCQAGAVPATDDQCVLYG